MRRGGDRRLVGATRPLDMHPTLLLFIGQNRFTAAEFIAELERHGLAVGRRWRARIRGHYVLGLADRVA